MQRRLPVVLALVLGFALAGPAAIATHAQDKSGRVVGTVELVNKDTKTILVGGEAGNKPQQVVFGDKTKFTKDNKPGKLDDVQNGSRVICLGTPNDKGQLVATHVDVRPAH